jgi:drug/metabolite transporter (DMT)-like permease
LGILLLLGTCVSSAAYKTANRKAALEFSPFERTFLVVSCSAVVFTFAALRDVNWDLRAYVEPLGDIPYLLSVLALSALCSVAADIMVNYAAARMSVFKVSSFGALSTLCTAFAGIVFLKEPFSIQLALGTVLILVGVYLVTGKKQKK